MDTIQTTAYHGTTEKKAENILRTGAFYKSNKDIEWLGSGVYFFQYRAHAVWWAKNEVKKKKNAGQSPAILSAKLTYTEQQQLDLDDPDVVRQLNEFVKKALESSTNLNNFYVDLEADKAKKWCFACELYKKHNEQIGIIMYTFPRPSYKGKGIYSENQKQICVNDETIISDISLVILEDDHV